ncbi:hypothetical protein DVA86_14665 [Streptomyces armeniacus]|uniref:Uncharacterized protein n=1 Tax=Streptomyces armeniacus TaxID=83291 RepID=A0A345XPZ7_9ACTN|nr:hypothetical protein [Streptomyces armeniacus]AXK33713.1 hypothetical protein DVA86_14665 [Streptomyces armeniacus]
MAGREEPPQGPPEGSPGGGDDEYGSLVFDESFVEAARLQEFSAQERLEDEEHAAVRSRPARAVGKGISGFSASRQGIVLVLLILIAFGTAIYMGIQNPYPSPSGGPTEPMRLTMLPLAPRGEVPGSTPGDLFEHSPAAQFRTGAEGVTLPSAHGSEHFSESQVLAALTGAKDYVVASSLDPAVLTGNAARSVRILLDPAQLEQFDQSIERPRSDGQHAATGWMVRFDPSKVALADRDIRVNGTLAVEETGPNALEVTADHVFVYALRPAGAGEGEKAAESASLFTVRREMRFHFERDDLRDHQLHVEQAAVRAGPMACTSDPAETLTPLLAGERAEDDGPAGTDPYARGPGRGSLCGVLSESAQPNPTR